MQIKFNESLIFKDKNDFLLWSWSEKFLFFGQKNYKVCLINKKNIEIARSRIKSNLLPTMIKAILCFSIALPFTIAVFIFRSVYRKKYTFQLIDKKNKTHEILNNKDLSELVEKVEKNINQINNQNNEQGPQIETDEKNAPKIKQEILGPERENKEIKNPDLKKVNSELPLEKTSGFPNAGSTCFIGATLQCLRNIPTFCRILSENHPLQKFANESEEKFQLRNDIRAAMKILFEKSNKGEGILKEEMRNFRKLLHSYNARIPSEGFGDRDEVGHSLFAANEIVGIKMVQQRPDQSVEYYDKNLFNINCNKNEPFIIQKALDSSFQMSTSIPGYPQIVALPPILSIPIAGYDTYPSIEISEEIEVQSLEQSHVKYRLVSFLQTPPGHYIAHLRDLNEEQLSWVTFNDASVKKTLILEENVKKQISHLFYERVET